MPEVWAVGEAYERYVGRWSRPVAREFLCWLDVSPGRWWLDVGCGTGALSEAVLVSAAPAGVVGVDTAVGFLTHARARFFSGRRTGVRAMVCAGDARRLPLRDRCVETVVSGLALNFVPDAYVAVTEMARVVAAGGVVAAYVWDYSGGMAMIRHFWRAAAQLDHAARELDEAYRFPLCQPRPLLELWSAAGLRGATVEAVEVPTRFDSFDDYWTPFLGGQGPAPGYVASLPEPHRQALREALRSCLPTESDGQIPLTARAWAVRGTTSRSR